MIDITEIHASLDRLKAAGLIDYTINKINTNSGDDIITIKVLPEGWEFADVLNYFHSTKENITLH